jgi:hypothetical protein
MLKQLSVQAQRQTQGFRTHCPSLKTNMRYMHAVFRHLLITKSPTDKEGNVVDMPT